MSAINSQSTASTGGPGGITLATDAEVRTGTNTVKAVTPASFTARRVVQRVSTQFDKTNTTLAAITGLSANVVAAGVYKFTAVLFVNADATGGYKFDLSGTATATSVVAQIIAQRNDTQAFTLTSRVTALASSAGAAAGTALLVRIEGLIVVNAAGTLTPRFAQNAANGTSSVLAGSWWEVEAVQ